MRLKKPMVCGVIFGAIAGGLMGWGGSYGTAFANQGILTIAVYAEAGAKAFACYLTGCCIAFFGTAISTYVIGFEDIPEEEEVKKSEDISVLSPVTGKVKSIKDNDIKILPEIGEITASSDCEVKVIYPSLQAIGLTMKNDRNQKIELFIHIGENLSELNGKYFEKYVEVGDKIKKGDKILSFDMEKIKEEGYDTTVSISVANKESYNEIASVTEEGNFVNERTEIMIAVL